MKQSFISNDSFPILLKNETHWMPSNSGYCPKSAAGFKSHNWKHETFNTMQCIVSNRIIKKTKKNNTNKFNEKKLL